MNHYEVLGVPMGADPAEIRRSYLRLARRHHPDFHTTDDPATQARARRTMQQVNDAWRVLSDPARRRQYDDAVRQGTAGTARPRTAGPSGAAGPPPGRPWTPRAADRAWMDDFEAWRNDTGVPPPLDDPEGGPTRPLMILPVALFVAAVALGCVSLVMQVRALLAVAFVGVGLSAILFFVRPMFTTIRDRHHG